MRIVEDLAGDFQQLTFKAAREQAIQVVDAIQAYSVEKFIAEFEAAVNRAAERLTQNEKIIISSAVNWLADALRANLKGTIGIGLDFDASEKTNLEEALSNFSELGNITAILTKELAGLKVDGLTTLQRSRFSDYRPVFSINNSNAVPVLEQGAGSAENLANEFLISLVSLDEAEGLSAAGKSLLDKMSRLTVAALLTSEIKETSDLKEGDEWKNALLQKMAYMGYVPDGRMITYKNGRIYVDQGILYAFILAHMAEQAVAQSA